MVMCRMSCDVLNCKQRKEASDPESTRRTCRIGSSVGSKEMRTSVNVMCCDVVGDRQSSSDR